MECGDTTNVDQLAAWIDGALATSVLGDTLVNIDDFDPASLNLISCGEEVEVLFSVIDNVCSFVETCMSTVRVEDNTPPNITCPPTINVNSTDLDLTTIIDDWLAMVEADDNGCFGVAQRDDYDPSLVDFCDQAAPLDITFTAVSYTHLTLPTIYSV